jgi:hypothetical protein
VELRLGRQPRGDAAADQHERGDHKRDADRVEGSNLTPVAVLFLRRPLTDVVEMVRRAQWWVANSVSPMPTTMTAMIAINTRGATIAKTMFCLGMRGYLAKE